MTLRQLEIFLALVKSPHLIRVANEMGLTQSAVSMAIKTLEDTVETKLFDRINKRLVLNENGRYFAKKIEPLFMEINEAENIFKDKTLHGELKIGASSSIANYILPQIIYDFLETYEGVRIEKSTGNTRDIIEAIENGGADIGFVEGEFSSVDIRKEVLGTDELFVVTGNEEYAGKKECVIDDLLSKPWILREKGSGTREVFLRHLGDNIKRINVFMEMDHTEAIKSVLYKKNTLSCLSQFTVREELLAGQLFKINVRGHRFTRSFYTIWHKNKYFSSLLTEFMAFTKKKYNETVPL
jgi:DNA-binding transcriptional LysR family regulator